MQHLSTGRMGSCLTSAYVDVPVRGFHLVPLTLSACNAHMPACHMPTCPHTSLPSHKVMRASSDHTFSGATQLIMLCWSACSILQQAGAWEAIAPNVAQFNNMQVLTQCYFNINLLSGSYSHHPASDLACCPSCYALDACPKPTTYQPYGHVMHHTLGALQTGCTTSQVWDTQGTGVIRWNAAGAGFSSMGAVAENSVMQACLLAAAGAARSGTTAGASSSGSTASGTEFVWPASIKALKLPTYPGASSTNASSTNSSSTSASSSSVGSQEGASTSTSAGAELATISLEVRAQLHTCLVMRCGVGRAGVGW